MDEGMHSPPRDDALGDHAPSAGFVLDGDVPFRHLGDGARALCRHRHPIPLQADDTAEPIRARGRVEIEQDIVSVRINAEVLAELVNEDEALDGIVRE